MEPAPLPPHERHWRHPSELAPPAVPVPSGGSRALVIATGTTALLLAAVLVIALAPARTSAPIAVSATTLPPATIQLRTAPVTVAAPSADEQSVLTFDNMMRPDRGVALLGAPNAISAAPVGRAEDFSLARGLPTSSDRVIVLTTSHAYNLRWSDIDHISAPDGSIVMTRDGRLVAVYVSGELRLLVND